MKAITSGVNFPATRQHIELAYKICGKDLSVIKSKSKKPSKIRVELLPDTIIIVRKLVLSADMFVEAHAFLMSVTHSIGVTTVKYLGPISTRDVRTTNRL